jgi:hypothetical protein
MSTIEPFAPSMDQDIAAVQEGLGYLTDIERRLAPYFERAEPRQRALAAGGRLRAASKPPTERSAWMTTRCAVGQAGTAISLSRCGPMRASASCEREPSPWRQ